MLATKTYLLGSIVMGSLQVADAVILQRIKGRLPLIAMLFSISEYAWAFVSFKVWRANEADLPAWLPASFVVYVLAGFVVGIVLAAKGRGREFKIPDFVLTAGGIFGLVFFTAAAALYSA